MLRSKASLLPQFPGVTVKNGVMSQLDPDAFLSDNARVMATGTITIAGTVTQDDTVMAKLTHPLLPTGSVTKTVVTTGSDTVVSLAQKLAKALSDDAILRSMGAYFYSLDGVVTLKWPGPVGNLVTLEAWADSTTATITLGGSATNTDRVYVKFANADLPNGAVLVYATITSGMTTTQMATAVKDAINANSDLADEGISATSNAAVVTVEVGSQSPTTIITSWPWQVTKTVTAGGTVTALEEVTLTITNATLPGGDTTVSYKVSGKETVTVGGTVTESEQPQLTITSTSLPGGNQTFIYTVQAGDDEQDVAQGFADLINADSEMIAAGITASAAAGVCSIVYPGSLATVTFSRVNGANTTLTLAAAATNDTASTVVAALAAAINANSELSAAGIAATANSDVCSITVPGAIGAVTYSRTNGANTTLTLGPTPTETSVVAGNPTETVTPVAFSGGSGPIVPADDFSFSFGGTVLQFRAGQPVIANGELVAALLAAKMRIE